MNDTVERKPPAGTGADDHNKGAPATVDHQTVEKVARLARLELREGDVPRYAAEMDAILALVAHMNSIPTEGVEPMAHPVGTSQRLREDQVSETDQRSLFQAGAPSTQDHLYLVPRVVE